MSGAEPLPARAAAWLAALAGFGFYLVCFYPGAMSPDSAHAWWVARGGASENVQGVGMTWLWWLTGNLAPGPGGPFVVIQALFWGALALIAQSTAAAPAARVGLVAACGFAPVCCVLLMHVWSDVAMMAALTASVAVLLRFRRSGHVGWLAAALLLLWFALLLRHNAAPAVAPLFAYAAWLWSEHDRRAHPARRWRVAAVAAGAGLLWTAAALADRAVERRVDAFPSLALWDLAAISIKTDTLLLPEGTHGKGLDIADLRGAFEPYANVSLFTQTHAGMGSPFPDADDPIGTAIASAWWQAVRAHPGAYLAHRWRVTRGLFGTRPRAWPHQLVYFDGDVDYQDNPHVAGNGTSLHVAMVRLFERARASIVLAAWPYLLVALTAGVLAWRRRAHPGAQAALAVLASGLLYAAPLPFIAPSVELRYVGWSCLAAVLGAALALVRPAVPRAPA